MAEKRTYNFPEGELILIDKPAGWTSFDVVNKLRNMLRHHLGIKKIKVGHAGTLDPLATGLLLVCVGKATKKISTFTGMDKEYEGSFFIGASTPSFDLETAVDQEYEISHINEVLIEEARKSFLGNISQIPPVFSAIKVEGTRAYIKAREKEKVNMPPREVSINEFDIIRTELPQIDFRLRCSKGTYVRSLAYDFGKALRSGAYLKSLRRTMIGNYHVDDASGIKELEEELMRLKQSV